MICVKIKRTFLSLRPRGPKDTARNNMQGALTVCSPPSHSPPSFPCSTPLPLCGVSLSRVETANRRFTCFLYIKHSFFFLSVVLPFSHADFIFIDAGQEEGEGRWRLQRPSLDIGINKDVVLGQTSGRTFTLIFISQQ